MVSGELCACGINFGYAMSDLMHVIDAHASLMSLLKEELPHELTHTSKV